MSTRGFISFTANGETKTAYNQHDSYPDGLGLDFLGWARSADLSDAAASAAALRVVDSKSDPSDEDVENLRRFADFSVDAMTWNGSAYVERTRPSWYQLLRTTQGDPAAMLAAGVIGDGSTFPADSLFAEWGYVVDFDAQVLEVYVGFQQESHSEGRFASSTPNGGGYYPVRLVKAWPLSDLPDDGAFIAECEKAGA